MRVVRELTENRSKLACARTNLAERLAELQHEYMRLMRVADLSRVVSKENVAKAAKATKGLKQVSFHNPCAANSNPIPPIATSFMWLFEVACWSGTHCTSCCYSPNKLLCDWHHAGWQHVARVR